ncbi:MAG: hypothetical protein N4A35_03100 [Flavobacteriales bacterium]|jgi:uncharacterized membrane protein|nr:hypothetical protein [Flavobacteriales bacterium]
MTILKTSIEWAKDEIFSSWVFILFGLLFLIASIGFWQLGKTEIAKAFIAPMLIAGSILLVAGVSFYFSNKSRLINFETAYQTNPVAFVNTEIEHTEKTMRAYEKIAFKVFPIIIGIGALILVFIDSSTWRAIIMTILGLLMLILLIDSHAHARLKAYHKQLQQEQNI